MHDAKTIAAELRNIARHLDVEGEMYRARAYWQAAVQVEARAAELSDRIAAGTLTELQGIGPATERVILELWHTGHSNYLDRIRERIPEGVVELGKLRGVGPRRAMTLFRVLDVKSPTDLRAACEAHRVRGLRGFGEKLEQRLFEAVLEWEAKRRPESPPPRYAPQMTLPL